MNCKEDIERQGRREISSLGGQTLGITAASVQRTLTCAKTRAMSFIVKMSYGISKTNFVLDFFSVSI